MCQKTRNDKFSNLKRPNKIWAVSSIHGDLDRLIQLHDAIFERFAPGDRLVYLGNYTGYGSQSRETIDELLVFRRLLLAQPGMKPSDIVYLRGAQEELWYKLTQLHFAPKPVDTLLWMMASGMSNTMQSYGICAHDGIMAAREGTVSLTRWTNKVRETLRQNAGHDCFMTHSKRAAYTEYDNRTPILFVNAGLDPARTLEQQDDNLWWAGETFSDMTESYAPFEKVIRGFDPRHEGVHINCVTATLDGGCGFGGSLVAASMSAEGEIQELMEV
ncbi:MAG: hypothetical protein R3D88_01245 [Alphaproteobacteria bacterium]|nr:hypothetical protein [Alphaproteobacteria bacterium]